MDSLLQDARACLDSYISRGLEVPDREHVVAYATLVAWVGHFPVRADPQDFEVVKKCESIFHKEKDRFFKQRRIALKKIMLTVNGTNQT